MTTALLDPINWSLTYGPQELDNWLERISIYEQLCCSPCHQQDEEDFMSYDSHDVV